MGCSIASRSSAAWSISRSSRLMAISRAVHQIADGEIAHAISLNGALNRLLGQTGHQQQLLLQFFQTLLKAYARHPNLPVM